MLRKIRITLALIIFTLVTLLFLDITGAVRLWFGVFAKIQFWPAVLALNLVVVGLLLILTFLLGRIYCSVICPLGVMQDAVSALHGRRKKNRFRFSPEKKWLRYGVLAAFLVAFAFGANAIVSLLAPYSSYGRIAGNLFRPVYESANNVLAAIAEHFNSYAFYSVDVWIRSIPTFVVAAITFIVVAVLAWRGGRTYCNTICPIGTILSLVARFSWFKVKIDSGKCVNCGLCAKNCKASAIDLKNKKIDYGRCVVCGNCIDKCRKDAITYGHAVKPAVKASVGQENNGNGNSPDSGRRAFLLGTAIATTTALLAQDKKKVDGGLAVIEDKVAPGRLTPLTPPGSMSAQNMARHCTACQLCVSACPNGVLRPSSDLSKFMQPTMSYERGYCRPECTKCSEACPTGAIKPITRADKSSTQIGHAVFIKKNCVAYNSYPDLVSCGNCARHCPAGAIMMTPFTFPDGSRAMIPSVNEARCIGCGACENLCPARPFSAIYVEGHEVHKTI